MPNWRDFAFPCQDVDRQWIGDHPVYEFMIVEWRWGAKWLAPSIVVDGLDAMKTEARQLALTPGVESFYVLSPDGAIQPEQLRRLTGFAGC
jgi:hypothetical protein